MLVVVSRPAVGARRERFVTFGQVMVHFLLHDGVRLVLAEAQALSAPNGAGINPLDLPVPRIFPAFLPPAITDTVVASNTPQKKVANPFNFIINLPPMPGDSANVPEGWVVCDT